MNPRIRLDDLNDTPYKEVIYRLTVEWVHAELPAEGLTYDDIQTGIKILLLTTQSADRTAAIVKAVLTQATALNKTSDWVDQELKFEGMIEGADRADFLLLDLQQADIIDDDMLDDYNERINRFTVHTS